MGFPPRESDVEGMTAGDVICRTPRAVNTPHPAMQAESVISKNPVDGHQRQACTIKPRLVNIVPVIRSSPFVGLCYDTQHVEAMLFPVALPDTPPCRM